MHSPNHLLSLSNASISPLKMMQKQERFDSQIFEVLVFVTK
jgi:hypothetical protein